MARRACVPAPPPAPGFRGRAVLRASAGLLRVWQAKQFIPNAAETGEQRNAGPIAAAPQEAATDLPSAPSLPVPSPAPFLCTSLRRPCPAVLRGTLCWSLKPTQARLLSAGAPPDEVTISHRHGLPLVTLTLPSRRERCQFVVKPMLSTVGSFLQDLHAEDKGIKRAAIFTTGGSLIPASTLIDVLLKDDFKLIIDDRTYDVQCPPQEDPRGEPSAELEKVKSLVHRLFTVLHLEELHKPRERLLLQRISSLKAQLLPLEQMKAQIEARSETRAGGLLWAGLALLSVQGGALAWLTWWVYSWDLMEPVTYFITFANSMVFFAYFLVTRQDYAYSAIKNRQFLYFFHKKSQKQHFDVAQYNQLKDELAKAQESLRQLRLTLSAGTHRGGPRQ